MRKFAAFLLCALFVFACNNEEPKEPEDDNPDNPEEVMESISEDGGTVAGGDVSIIIPQGTFGGSTMVSIAGVASGSTLGKTKELSNYYEVSLDGGTSKEIEVSIKADEGEAGTGVLVRANGWARHKGGLQPINTLLEAKYKDGAYNATIPIIESDGGQKIKMTLGVARDYAAQASKAETKASPNGVTYKLSWIENGGAYEEKILAKVRPFIDEALPKVEALGFRIPAGTEIPIQLTGTNDWGNFVQHNHVNSWSHVELSEAKFSKIDSYNENDLMELRKTLIHELMHYYCAIGYERRKAETVVLEGVNGSIWTVMDEAAGSWSEKMSGDNEIGLNSVVGSYVTDFGQSFFPPKLDLTISQSHGYAMALFLEYISKQVKSNLVVEAMYKKRNELFDWSAYANRPSLKDVFEKTLKEEPYTINFFNRAAYSEFVDSLLMGCVDTRVSAEVLCPKGTKITASAQYLNHEIYDFGFVVTRLAVDTQGMSNIETKKVRVEQKNEAIDTYFLIRYKGGWQKVPIERLDYELAATDFTGGKDIYVVEMNHEFGKLAEGKSNRGALRLQITEPAPELKLSAEKLHYQQGGGSQFIAVETNCTDISWDIKAPWIIRAIYDKGVLEVVANYNDHEEENTGTITVTATNGTGSISETVELTQEGKITMRQRKYWGVYVDIYNLPLETDKGKKVTMTQKLPLDANAKMIPVWCSAEVVDTIMTVSAINNIVEEKNEVSTSQHYESHTTTVTYYSIILHIDLRKTEEILISGQVRWGWDTDIDYHFDKDYVAEGSEYAHSHYFHHLSFDLAHMPFKESGYRMDWLSDEYGYNYCDRLIAYGSLKDKEGNTHTPKYYIQNFSETYSQDALYGTSKSLRDVNEGDWNLFVGLYGKDQGKFIPWGTPEDELPDPDDPGEGGESGDGGED